MRSLLPLFTTQFLSAFIDNVVRMSAIIFIFFYGDKEESTNYQLISALCTGLLILPFFLFSATAGQIADKYNKRKVIIALKIFELIPASLASLGFIYENHYLILAAIFLFGVQSTFFGPLKYSIIPEVINSSDEKKLRNANGKINAGSFVAILLGTVWGMFAFTIEGFEKVVTPVTLISATLLSLFAATKIADSKAQSPSLEINYNIITNTLNLLKDALKNAEISSTIRNIGWFWFVGALMLTVLPVAITRSNNVDELADIMNMIFGLMSSTAGLTIGAILVGYGFVSARLINKLNYLIGLSVCMVALTIMMESFTALLVNMLLVAFFSGLYVVPRYARLQKIADPKSRARIIAANNINNSLMMVCSSILIGACSFMGEYAAHIAVISGGLMALLGMRIKKA